MVVDGESYFLPGGTEIGLSVQGMVHSREGFGDDAKCFGPKRWLEEKGEERLTMMTRTTDLIFGHGRWTKAPLGLFVINDMWVQVTAR